MGPMRGVACDCSTTVPWQAVEGSLGRGHPMYATILTTYADLERVTDNKPQAVALYRQALETLDALGASHSGGQSPPPPPPPRLNLPPSTLCGDVSGVQSSPTPSTPA